MTSTTGSARPVRLASPSRSEEHTSELQSQSNLVCRLELEKKHLNSSHSQISYAVFCLKKKKHTDGPHILRHIRDTKKVQVWGTTPTRINGGRETPPTSST